MLVLVQSSAIKSLDYDEGAETLEVALTTGRTYLYFEVPRGEYEGLLTAPSMGAYYNAHIRVQYQFKELT